MEEPWNRRFSERKLMKLMKWLTFEMEIKHISNLKKKEKSLAKPNTPPR